MSEFEEHAIGQGIIRGALTMLAAILTIFGVLIGFFFKPVGTVMILSGIAILAWSIRASWKDTNALRWINITIKTLLILIAIAGLVSLYVSGYV